MGLKPSDHITEVSVLYYGARNCMLPNKCVRNRERCPLYSGRIVQSWHFETYRAVHNIEVFVFLGRDCIRFSIFKGWFSLAMESESES